MSARCHKPVREAEWVEHPPPTLGDRGIRRSAVRIQTSPSSNPGWVKPMILKLIFVAPLPGVRHYYDRAGTHWLSVRIMRLGGIAGHGASGMVFQRGITIKSPWVRTVTSQYSPPLSPHWACRATVKHIFIPHQTNSSLWVLVVPPLSQFCDLCHSFPKCASSNYTTKRTTQTYMYMNLNLFSVAD